MKKHNQLSPFETSVEKAYAMQAGREIRVIVSAEKISDSQTINLERELAKLIETELTYPGKIKVTVRARNEITSTIVAKPSHHLLRYSFLLRD